MEKVRLWTVIATVQFIKFIYIVHKFCEVMGSNLFTLTNYLHKFKHLCFIKY